MQVVHHFGHLVGGTLLVAGTSIGLGMLALPVATAGGGFFPSLAIYFACWLFMLCTGLLVLEATLWMPKDTNLITMAYRLLGPGGRIFCWALYLFLFTCLMVAHVAGGGTVIHQITGSAVPAWLGMIIYTFLLAVVVYLGTLWVDRLNVLLMGGVILTYLVFVGASASHVNVSLLTHVSWSKAWVALPVVFTAFGYQSLIPTLVNYMQRDLRKIRIALIIGTVTPLVIYVIWQFLILGIIPLEGPQGLAAAFQKGQNAVTPLGYYLQNDSILKVGEAFAFFVLTTSFLGISIAYVDFLADGLKVEKKGLKKVGLCALIFSVPTLIALINPTIFLTALNYAGGYGVALLLGAMPVAMVWAGRYYKGHSLLHQQLPGGKIVLSILMAFVIFELIMQF